MTDLQESPARAEASLLETYAHENGISGKKMFDALAQTIFPSPRDATPERVHALLIVARQYGLSPWTRELYAFPAKGKGIVPVVSVDGWLKLVNGNPACEGVEVTVEMEADGRTPISATAKIYRRGWKVPVEVTEYVHEVRRNTEPWRNQPVRMIRHRAIIQAARIAFGFSGIYEADEAARFAATSSPEHQEQESSVLADMRERVADVDSEVVDQPLAERDETAAAIKREVHDDAHEPSPVELFEQAHPQAEGYDDQGGVA